MVAGFLARERVSSRPVSARIGSDVGLVESGVYVARATASIIMVSNSIGVSFPKPRWRRLR